MEHVIEQEKNEVIKVINDPDVSLETIKDAYYGLEEKDRDRMPYVEKLIVLES